MEKNRCENCGRPAKGECPVGGEVTGGYYVEVMEGHMEDSWPFGGVPLPKVDVSVEECAAFVEGLISV